MIAPLGRCLVHDVNVLLPIPVVLVMGGLAGPGWQRSVAIQRSRETTAIIGDEARLLDPIGQTLREAGRTELDYLLRGAATRPCILLVEDNTAVREITAGILRELGYRVGEAREAEQALGLLYIRGADGQAAGVRAGADGAVALLLTDIVLPGALDGGALAARVRQLAAYARALHVGQPRGCAAAGCRGRGGDAPARQAVPAGAARGQAGRAARRRPRQPGGLSRGPCR